MERMVRIVPNDYSPKMYGLPEEIVGTVLFIKIKDLDKAQKLLHTSPIINETYIRSPYDDDMFFKIEDYEIESWKAKIRHISNIARILGATSATFNMQVGNKQCRNKHGDVKGGSDPVGNISINFTKEEQQQLQAIIQSNLQFSSAASIPSEEEYEEAVFLAQSHNLYYGTDGTQVRQLLDNRKPQTRNPLTQWDFHTNLCSETNSDLKLAANLAIPSLCLKIDSDFENAIKYVKTVQVDVSFNF